MPTPSWSPSMVPYGADETVYLVIDRFRTGTVYRETEVDKTDLETILSDLLTGQFNDPVRVVAFNTVEHWAADVSAAVALEIETRCDIQGERLPDHLSEFVQGYSGANRQLTFRLA